MGTGTPSRGQLSVPPRARRAGRQGLLQGFHLFGPRCIRFEAFDDTRERPDTRAMLARVRSGHSVRHRADDVFVEVDVAPGLPSFITVGLPDSAVRESRDRVRAAIRNAGLEFPVDRIMVNLAPAEVRKVGTAFDLPMALGILAATGVVKPALVEDAIALGGALARRTDPARARCAAGGAALPAS